MTFFFLFPILLLSYQRKRSPKTQEEVSKPCSEDVIQQQSTCPTCSIDQDNLSKKSINDDELKNTFSFNDEDRLFLLTIDSRGRGRRQRLETGDSFLTASTPCSSRPPSCLPPSHSSSMQDMSQLQSRIKRKSQSSHGLSEETAFPCPEQEFKERQDVYADNIQRHRTFRQHREHYYNYNYYQQQQPHFRYPSSYGMDSYYSTRQRQQYPSEYLSSSAPTDASSRYLYYYYHPEANPSRSSSRSRTQTSRSHTTQNTVEQEHLRPISIPSRRLLSQGKQEGSCPSSTSSLHRLHLIQQQNLLAANKTASRPQRLPLHSSLQRNLMTEAVVHHEPRRPNSHQSDVGRRSGHESRSRSRRRSNRKVEEKSQSLDFVDPNEG